MPAKAGWEKLSTGEFLAPLRIFKTQIPLAVKAAETSATGTSIFTHDKNGKVAQAYENLAREVAGIGERCKNDPALS